MRELAGFKPKGTDKSPLTYLLMALQPRYLRFLVLGVFNSLSYSPAVFK